MWGEIRGGRFGGGGKYRRGKQGVEKTFGKGMGGFLSHGKELTN